MRRSVVDELSHHDPNIDKRIVSDVHANFVEGLIRIEFCAKGCWVNRLVQSDKLVNLCQMVIRPFHLKYENINGVQLLDRLQELMQAHSVVPVQGLGVRL